jgi:hypothetical protein
MSDWTDDMGVPALTEQLYGSLSPSDECRVMETIPVSSQLITLSADGYWFELLRSLEKLAEVTGPFDGIPVIDITILPKSLLALGPDLFAAVLDELESGADEQATMIDVAVKDDGSIIVQGRCPCDELPAGLCPTVQEAVAVALSVADGALALSGFSIEL